MSDRTLAIVAVLGLPLMFAIGVAVGAARPAALLWILDLAL